VTFAKSERADLCDLLDTVGPDAPTLCEGWNTHDLAAHLWIRETDPVGATSMVAKPLAGLLERRTAEIKSRWEFAELVNRVRRGPARFSVFAFPGVDEGANTTEFFIHHEDVRRGRPGWEPRQLDPGQQAALWRGVSFTAKLGLRRLHIPVLVRAPGFGEVTVGEGTPQATLTGEPGELALFVSGRQRAARVDVDGPPEAAERLRTAALGM
jgi:uncharacterized protein (TIGR03085 family)